MIDYLLRVVIAADAFFGVVLGGNVGETISARAFTAQRDHRTWGCILCWLLDKLDSNHCSDALSNDRLRAQRVLDDLDTRIEDTYL